MCESRLLLRLEEGQQILVDLVLERRAQAVRGALVDLQHRVLDELGLKQAGVGERHDLVVVALDDQRRDVDLLQVLGLIRLGERLDAEIRGRETRPSSPAARMTRAPPPRPSRPGGCSRRTAG